MANVVQSRCNYSRKASNMNSCSRGRKGRGLKSVCDYYATPGCGRIERVEASSRRVVRDWNLIGDISARASGAGLIFPCHLPLRFVCRSGCILGLDGTHMHSHDTCRENGNRRSGAIRTSDEDIMGWETCTVIPEGNSPNAWPYIIDRNACM
jgi:hypothetical protein